MAAFIGGFCVAFWAAWDVTLVMVACMPFLAAALFATVSLITGIDKKLVEMYEEVRERH